MNLLELKNNVDNAVAYAQECGEPLETVVVSLQIEGPGKNQSVAVSSNVELHYDNNLNASSCVMLGYFGFD